MREAKNGPCGCFASPQPRWRIYKFKTCLSVLGRTGFAYPHHAASCGIRRGRVGKNFHHLFRAECDVTRDP